MLQRICTEPLVTGKRLLLGGIILALRNLAIYPSYCLQLIGQGFSGWLLIVAEV
jgi:hypothetical protein